MTEAQTTEAVTIPLADICKELGIKPQSARIKLRKKLAAAKGEGFRWEFTEDKVDEVKTILTAKTERKGKAEGEGEGEGEGEE